MGTKFGRTYKLLIETSDGNNIEVAYPITMEFTVVRHNLASTNTASLVIYNLSEDTRKKIYKDQYNISDRRAIQLYAGYNDGTQMLLPMVFNGEIRSAYSTRRGPDVRTEIECFDGGFAMANSFSSQSIGQGATQAEIIARLAKDLQGVEGPPTIGNFLTQVAKRGLAVFGNPAEILKQITNNNFYIDNQRAYILNKDEVVLGEVAVISSESGIIETPRRADTQVEVTIVFEPRIKVSQMISLESITEKNFVGIYKVVGFQHRGVISGATAGDCTTTVSLLSGNKFVPVASFQ